MCDPPKVSDRPVAVRFRIDLDEHRAQSTTTILKPEEIAYFSYDDDRVLHPFSDISLRYYYPPLIGLPSMRAPQPIDLSKGHETFRERDQSVDEHLEGLLETLIESEKRTGVRTEADLITWRGMMTKIVTAPYQQIDGDSIEMNATKFQGTIFIEEDMRGKLENESKGRKYRDKAGLGDLPVYWGYKFETLCMLDKPWDECTREEIEERENAVVNNNAQYCSLVKTQIGETTMVLAGEVDGVQGHKPDNPKDSARWVELKTARRPESNRDMWIHDKKMLKFWAQSYLLGVPKIVIGFRSRSGHLLSVEEVETQGIPNLVKTSGKMNWNGNVCINFAAAFLKFLKAMIVGDGVWRIQRQIGSDFISVRVIQTTGTGDILTPKFLAWRKELADREAPKAPAGEAAGEV